MATEPEIVSGDPHGTEALYAAMAEAVIRYPARKSFLGDTLIVPKSQRKAFVQGAKWQAMREAERRRLSHGG